MEPAALVVCLSDKGSIEQATSKLDDLTSFLVLFDSSMMSLYGNVIMFELHIWVEKFLTLHFRHNVFPEQKFAYQWLND